MTPITNGDIRDGTDFPRTVETRRTGTNSNGYYRGIMFPKEPFDQAFNYSVYAKYAYYKDKTRSKLSQPTDPLMPGDEIEVDMVFEGFAPLQPLFPIGKLFGLTGREYNFYSFTFDLDSKEIYFRFYWGEGNIMSDWLGPFRSFQLVKASNIWENQGGKKILLAAMDEKGNISPESYSHVFKILP